MYRPKHVVDTVGTPCTTFVSTVAFWLNTFYDLGIACSHLVRNTLLFHFLSENMKIKTELQVEKVQ